MADLVSKIDELSISPSKPCTLTLTAEESAVCLKAREKLLASGLKVREGDELQHFNDDLID